MPERIVSDWYSGKLNVFLREDGDWIKVTPAPGKRGIKEKGRPAASALFLIGAHV